MIRSIERPPWLAQLSAAIILVAAGSLAPTGQTSAQTRAMNASLAGQLRLFDLKLNSGRIKAIGPVSQQSLNSNYDGGQQRERLTIDLNGGLPTVSYEQVTAADKLSIDIRHSTKVEIQLAPRSPSEQPSVSFQQPTEGPLTLTVADGDNTTQCVAPTLWHLLILHPRETSEHLLPLLRVIHPQWQLADQARAIEVALLQADLNPAVRHRQQWQTALTGLASPRFKDRERAEEALRLTGTTVLPFLRAQDRSLLDAEQTFRIRRVIASLSPDNNEDTPESVSGWLLADPSIWFALMDREDIEVRRAAAAALQRLLGQEIEFNPGEGADVRQQQRAALRAHYGTLLVPGSGAAGHAER